MPEALFKALKVQFPEADDARLWQTVAMLIVAVADEQGVPLD